MSDGAAYAANWRTVLAVDALLGAGVAAGGAVLGAAWDALVGAFVVLGGVAYLVLVVRRWRRWARLRAEAGL